MLRKTITVRHRFGLHTYISMQCVRTARCFISDITLNFKDQYIDAKNISSMMRLQVQKGNLLEVVVQGQDEREALTALERLVNSEFQTEGEKSEVEVESE